MTMAIEGDGPGEEKSVGRARDGNGDFGEGIVPTAREIDGREAERLRAGGGRRGEVVDVDLKMRGVGGTDGKKMRVVTRVVGHVCALEAERSDAGGERVGEWRRGVLNGGHLEERIGMHHFDEDVCGLWNDDGLVDEQTLLMNERRW